MQAPIAYLWIPAVRAKVAARIDQILIRLDGGEVAYRDLRDFVRELEKEGELKRISVEVDPVLEITEITDRCVKTGGPALLFERPKGSSIPVVTNLVGSERRMNMSLEVDSLDDVAARISSFLDMQSPQGLLEKVKMLPKLAEMGSFSRKASAAARARRLSRSKDFRCETFRSSNAGLRTAAASSRGRW